MDDVGKARLEPQGAARDAPPCGASRPGSIDRAGALAPIMIDVEARYIEPNVWMRHTVTETDAVLQDRR